MRDENIRLWNFVKIAIYRDILRYLCGKRIAHDEVKNCIFDTNSEERLPLITETCAKPIICPTCRDEIKEALEKKKKTTEWLTKIEKELCKLKKGLYYRIKDCINNNPWASIGIAILVVIVLPIVTSVIASIIYGKITQ